MQSSRRRRFRKDRGREGGAPRTTPLGTAPQEVVAPAPLLATAASQGGREDRAIRLDGAPSDEGIFVEGAHAVVLRGGEVLDLAALGFLAGRGEGEPPNRLPAHLLSALFPDRLFCYSAPIVAHQAEARVGTSSAAADLRDEGVPLKAFYEPSFFESYDGEVRLVVSDGSAHVVTFREWRKDVANLDHFPVRYRRVVDLSLPEGLAEHRADTVLLARLARLVCDLVGSYVESGGETASVAHPGPLTNLFSGGGAPPPLFAPALFGRRLKDAYDDDSGGANDDGGDGAASGRGGGAHDALLPG